MTNFKGFKSVFVRAKVYYWEDNLLSETMVSLII